VLHPAAAVVMNVLMDMHATQMYQQQQLWRCMCGSVLQCVAGVLACCSSSSSDACLKAVLQCCAAVMCVCSVLQQHALMHMHAQANADRVAAVVELMRVLQCCAGVCSVLQQQLRR